MPGVLIIEAMAQTAAVLVVHTLGPESEGQARLFHERRQRPLSPPGASRRPSLRIHVTKQRNRGNVWKFEGEAKVDEQLDGRGRVRRDDPGRLDAPSMPQIHPTAIVAPGAQLAERCRRRPLLRRSASDVVLGATGRCSDRMSWSTAARPIGERHADLPVRLDRPRDAGSEIQGRAVGARSSAATTRSANM